MSSVDKQFMVEEVYMATVEAELMKQKAELARLWEAAMEEAKQKVEEEQQ